MKVVYCADDGTEFETEQECRDYEFELKRADFFEECVNVRAYDDNGNVVDFRDYDIECMEDAFQDIWFIQFTTQKAIDLFLEKGRHEFGLLYIDDDIHRDVKVGERYFYDTDKDEWVCLEDRQKELDKIANIFK
jgi:hypothetical protein